MRPTFGSCQFQTKEESVFLNNSISQNVFPSFSSASALMCWGCESNNHAFCTVNWNSSKITEQDKAIHYGKCVGGNVCFKSIVRGENGNFKNFHIFQLRLNQTESENRRTEIFISFASLKLFKRSGHVAWMKILLSVCVKRLKMFFV